MPQHIDVHKVFAEFFDAVRAEDLEQTGASAETRTLAGGAPWALEKDNVFGALAELLAASMNTNSVGGECSAPHVEKQVIDRSTRL